MKRFIITSLNYIPTTLCLLLCLLASNAPAASSYFDIDGTTAGFGTTGGGSYSWDDPNWSTSSAGTAATANWLAGDFARFPGPGSYTVTVNNSESMAGLVENSSSGSGTILTISAAGSGNLSIVPSATLTTGLPAQGFFVIANQTCVINAPITGSGGINLGLFSGTPCTISLFGNNTYSGGTVLQSSSYLVNFNNNNSFGTGPINVNGTTFAPLLAQGGSTITLANSWTNILNSGVNFGSAANTPVVLTGPWAMQAFNLNLRNNGDGTAPLTLNGVISGSGGTLTLSANNGGKITLGGANTYTGKTSISGGSNIPGVGMTVSVSSFNKVTGGSPSSNLGAPTTAANGTIGIGVSTFTSTLLYTGAGETTDRIIDLAGTTGGAKIQNDGSGALVFTSDFTATGAGAKTLTLQGANTGNNAISGKIVNGSSATSVTKDQAGTWVLSGANTYTGGTTVNAGTLEVSGSIMGNVTVNAGGLKLDSASALSTSATVSLVSTLSGGAVNLNFTGSQTVNALYIDGVPQANGTWGAVGNASAANQSALFSGTGVLNVVGAPVITQQPQSASVFPDSSVTFSVSVTGDPSFTYQWKHNGGNISGANFSDYTINPVAAADAGTYSCWITNSYGWTNTLDVTLTVLGTNSYVNAIRTDSPLAYWRLGETSGNLAYDGVGGNANLGQYVNVTLNQPGYSLTDSDPCIALPAGAGRGYVQVTNYTPFSFPGALPFSLEAWGYFTNLTGVQRILSTFRLTSPNGWAFGINGANGLRFTTGTVQDADQPLGTALVTGLWYHLVCTCDGSAYHFYVNGAEVGTGIAVIGSGNTGVATPLTLGCNPPAYTNSTAGDPLAEQVKGRIDEVAIYNYALSSLQVTNHYSARYGTLSAPVVSAPVANPPTNYVSLSASIEAVAAGQALSYQWYKGVSTLLSGKTDQTLTISPLQLSDAGSYWVRVNNPAGTADSPTTTLTVLPIPTSASELNLVNGLVLHLPFDSDYKDISGRSNHGTNVGTTTLVSPGVVGAKALHYFSDTGLSSFNYVTLGVRPDLKFGTSTDFTVSYWVRQPASSTYTNLPFFTDAVGSTGGNGGFAFAPYQTATTAGGWSLSIGTMSSPSQFTSFPDSDLINDGNWHHLVHSASRLANVTTYLDGAQVDSQSISFLGNIDTPNAATIGQDPSGVYPVTAQADIDDLAVWQRTLTPLEVSGIYLAGATNNVSFAPAILASPVNITSIVGTSLNYSGGAGSQFVLLKSASVNAALTSWARVTTNTATPGSFTIPTGSEPQAFYSIKSE